MARLCQERLGADPFSEWLFVFRNCSATALKMRVYDGQGFWLARKRLSSGRFPGGPAFLGSSSVAATLAHEAVGAMITDNKVA